MTFQTISSQHVPLHSSESSWSDKVVEDMVSKCFIFCYVTRLSLSEAAFALPLSKSGVTHLHEGDEGDPSEVESLGLTCLLSLEVKM